MAELIDTKAAETDTSSCCSTAAQSDCCEPTDKADCCTPESSSCGCSAGRADPRRGTYAASPTTR
jgi:hypothetical protein